MKKRIITAVSIVFCATHLSAMNLLWDESVNGDLPDGVDYLNPALFTLTSGSNTLRATLDGGTGSTSFDQDLFTITVPQNLEVIAINVLSYNSTPGNISFLLAQNQPTLSAEPSLFESNSTSDPINFVSFDDSPPFNPSGLLANLIVGMPISGNFFDPRLPAGEYAFWLNETGATSTFELDFVTQAVPEPSSALLGILAAGCLTLRRKRNFKR